MNPVRSLQETVDLSQQCLVELSAGMLMVMSQQCLGVSPVVMSLGMLSLCQGGFLMGKLRKGVTPFVLAYAIIYLCAGFIDNNILWLANMYDGDGDATDRFMFLIYFVFLGGMIGWGIKTWE